MARLTADDWLSRSSGATPEAIAVVGDDGRPVTYAELDALADRSGAFLQRTHGVGRGGLIGLPVAPRLDVVAALWGAGRLGAAAAVLDPASDLLGAGATALRRTWGIEPVVADLRLDGPPAAQPDPARDEARSGSDLHTVVFTSGTRGQPRPVTLTVGNVARAVAASRARLGNDATDRWLLALPLFHVGGLSVLWRSAAAGGTVVLHDGFDAARVAAALRHREVTVASLVPTMLHRVLETDPGPYRGLRAILVGGAPATRRLLERARAAGLPVVPTYGMTEACSQVATAVPGDPGGEEGAVGPPLDGVEVSIVDGAGRGVPPGGVGEIVVAGATVSPGYLGEAPRHGPHHTGDLGRFDAAGRLVVLGRRDDLIVTGGEKVLPDAIEAVLEAHPAVGRVAVVGVPDEEWGEQVAAVVAATAPLDPAVLRDWARERLARHAVPKQWVIVADLPLLATGKVDREAVERLARRALPAE